MSAMGVYGGAVSRLTLFVHDEDRSIHEGDSILVSATRSGDTVDLSQPLTVSLLTNRPGEVSLPGTVVIPAGQHTATFSLTALEDGEMDRLEAVRLNATANGFAVTRSDWVRLEDGTTGSEAPLINGFGGPATYTEDGPNVAIAATTAAIADPDSGNFAGGTFTARLNAGGTSGRSPHDPQWRGMITTAASTAVQRDGDRHLHRRRGRHSLVVTFNEQANAGKAAAVLRNIVYRNVSQNPSVRPRNGVAQVTDGDGGTSLAVTKTLNVVPVNERRCWAASAARWATQTERRRSISPRRRHSHADGHGERRG